MKRVGILYICTGKYVVFWKNFFESFESFFLPSCEKEYFVFTDATEIEYENNPRVHYIYQKYEKWPAPTLFRYKYFLSVEENLKKYDYLFFFNSNCEAVETITEDMFLPRTEKDEDLVCVLHTGYYKHQYPYPYERNPKSSAFIPYGKGKIYVFGALNGGTADAFLKMCHILDGNIDNDYRKGIIAKWHDESHWNKYIMNYNNYRLLSPAFLSPESPWFNMEGHHYIMLWDKSKYFDVHAIKDTNHSEQIPSITVRGARWIMRKTFDLLKSIGFIDADNLRLCDDCEEKQREQEGKIFERS